MSFTADVAIALFAICNSARVLAYIPQIVRVACDKDNAAAISYATWLMFAVANVSTVFYAIVVVNDMKMALVFSANTLCCLLIVALTLYKRAYAGRRAAAPLTER
jgi:uncharacterized protein with PQ loop repeat